MPRHWFGNRRYWYGITNLRHDAFEVQNGGGIEMFNPQVFAISRRILSEKLSSTRMVIMLPILILFIPGMAWGFSDPEIMLPGGITPESVMEVMFYTSLGVVFAGTMCGVLLSFDGISKDRFSGVLEVKLSSANAKAKTVSWNCSWTLVSNPNPSLVVMVNFNHYCVLPIRYDTRELWNCCIIYLCWIDSILVCYV